MIGIVNEAFSLKIGMDNNSTRFSKHAPILESLIVLCGIQYEETRKLTVNSWAKFWQHEMFKLNSMYTAINT